MKSLKVVLYARSGRDIVSNPKNSIEGQLCRLREYAYLHDCEVVAEFSDYCCRGNKRFTPGRIAILRMVNTNPGMIDSVLVVDRSRLSRNACFLYEFCEQLLNKGIEITVIDGPQSQICKPREYNFFMELMKIWYEHG